MWETVKVSLIGGIGQVVFIEQGSGLGGISKPVTGCPLRKAGIGRQGNPNKEFGIETTALYYKLYTLAAIDNTSQYKIIHDGAGVHRQRDSEGHRNHIMPPPPTIIHHISQILRASLEKVIGDQKSAAIL